jgi:hypothetical protein
MTTLSGFEALISRFSHDHALREHGQIALSVLAGASVSTLALRIRWRS